jgi:antirestriction protein ArdC
MKRDLYHEVTQRILDQMQAGVVPWQQAWRGNNAMPMNAVSNRPYSGINILLFWLGADKGYPTARYLTFKQAQEHGGHVRKGEHGRKVVFFKQLTVEDKNGGDDKTIPLLREYTVFNVAQCDDLPDHIVNGKALAALNTDERDSLADAFIKSTGADFREGTGKPCYIPSRDIISTPAFEQYRSMPAFYGDVFHELVHWTGHKSRLDRDNDIARRFGNVAYAAEELVAELGAAFINAEFGYDETPHNAAYLANWIQLLKDDSRAIFTAASKASKAAEYLRGLAIAEPMAEAA